MKRLSLAEIDGEITELLKKLTTLNAQRIAALQEHVQAAKAGIQQLTGENSSPSSHPARLWDNGYNNGNGTTSSRNQQT